MISKNSLKVVRNTPNLRELTTEALRNAILSMHFKPKQRLVERTLCEQTGVSRTCVREALQHLESEGLVNRVANKGLFVASVTADEARQIYEVRASLESSAGQMFVIRASKKEFVELEMACRRIEKSVKESEIMPYVSALDQFYDVLLSGAKNDVARTVLRTMRARMNYLRAITSQISDMEHKLETNALLRKIVEAAHDRNTKKTAKRCREFVERSAEFAIKILSEKEA